MEQAEQAQNAHAHDLSIDPRRLRSSDADKINGHYKDGHRGRGKALWGGGG